MISRCTWIVYKILKYFSFLDLFCSSDFLCITIQLQNINGQYIMFSASVSHLIWIFWHNQTNNLSIFIKLLIFWKIFHSYHSHNWEEIWYLKWFFLNISSCSNYRVLNINFDYNITKWYFFELLHILSVMEMICYKNFSIINFRIK